MKKIGRSNIKTLKTNAILFLFREPEDIEHKMFKYFAIKLEQNNYDLFCPITGRHVDRVNHSLDMFYAMLENDKETEFIRNKFPNTFDRIKGYL